MMIFFRLFGAFLLLITILPLFSTGKWFVRWWDFPRLQIAFLLTLAIAAGFVSWQRSVDQQIRNESIVWIILLVASLGWQVSHIIQFSPVWPKEVAVTEDLNASFKLMVSNLDKDNPQRETVPAELQQEQPDVLLLIEYDEAWATRLSELRERFTHHHEVVRGDGLGIALWSNLPVEDAETRHIISDRRASIWAKLKLETGQTVNFVGVHPTPPGLKDVTGEQRRDSRVRDAELILAAKEIAERSGESWIVAGDFNDVAWSHTTRLFKRISGVKDPRIGRSFMGTYIAQYPPLRCPIDHVFLSDGFTVSDLSRKRVGGADHFAVLATIALEKPFEGSSPEPKGNDHVDADKIIEEGKDDAKERDVETSTESD